MHSSAAPVVYVLDLTDATIRAGVHIDDTTVELHSIPTPRASRTKDAETALFEGIGSLLTELSSKAPLPDGISISTSGIMTMRPSSGVRSGGPFSDHELYIHAPNIEGLRYASFIERVEALGWNVPVHVENDLNSALHSIDYLDDVILISLGYGLGAGVKKHGRVRRPLGTWSCFEIGHGMQWTLPENMVRACHCGTTIGCMEAAIGGWAMYERYGRRPQRASEEVVARMRNDVVEVLPIAIASLVAQSQISKVLIGGKDAELYQETPYGNEGDFLWRIKERTEQLLVETKVDVDSVKLNGMAEMHGAAIALIDNHSFLWDRAGSGTA